MNSDIKILVVDDEPDVLRGTSRILEKAGYTVIESETGETALQCARKHLPDLILLDVVLPDMDGNEVCRILKGDSQTAGIFIAIISGKKIASDDQSLGLEIGADEYIVRPIANRELLARINAMLRLKNAEKELERHRNQLEVLVENKTVELRRQIKTREETEQTLQEKLEKIRFDSQILRAVEQAVIATDMQGHVIYWNAFAEKLFGWPYKEALGKTTIELIAAESSVEQGRKIMERLQKGESWSGEYLCRHRNGTEIPIFVTDSPIFDENGKMIGIIGVSKDITERKLAEKALLESERKAKTILKALPDLMFRLSSSGEHLDFYAPSLNQLYREPESFLGRHVEAVLPREVAQKYHQHIRKALKTEQLQVFEYQLEFPEGPRFFECRMVASGENETLSIVRNITDHKRAQEALRDSERSLREITENISEIFWVRDANTSKMLYLSPGFEKIFGVSCESVYEDPFSFMNLVVPEDIPKIKLAHEKQMKEGAETITEYRINRPDGEQKWVRARTSPAFDNHGVITRTVGVAIDITEQKRIENALRKLRERYELATKGGKVGIWDWNLITNEMFITPNLKKMLGYEDNEIRNHIEDWGKHVFAEDVEAVMREANACIEGKKPDYRIEHRMVHKDGGIRWLLASGEVQRNENGEPTRFFGTDTDITPLKALEEKLRQTQKMEALGTLSGGIAHEFNNILGIIIGNTELALDDVPEWNPAKDCLQEIRNASLRAKDVVRQIMSFSRKTPTTRKPIQISTIIQESLKLIRATIPTNIEIRQEILCKEDMILANPTEIGQILMNLCSNSVHAMEGEIGWLKVRLETTVLDDHSASLYNGLKSGEFVKLTVKDNGSGIDPRLIGSIFDPYFTTKDIDKGLGMGLAIVYGIVKKHDGAIRANSKVGKGSTLEVLFPVTKEIEEIEKKVSKDLPRGTERILFVDDEAPLVKMVTQMLQRQGYEVVGKKSSAEALKLFQEESDKFDLVITDMAMPEMPGDHLAKELIKIRPTIPVIICTGYSDRMNEATALKLGIAAYTMKPLVKEDLAKTVRKVLDEAKG